MRARTRLPSGRPRRLLEEVGLLPAEHAEAEALSRGEVDLKAGRHELVELAPNLVELAPGECHRAPHPWTREPRGPATPSLALATVQTVGASTDRVNEQCRND